MDTFNSAVSAALRTPITTASEQTSDPVINSCNAFAACVDYSFTTQLSPDPEARPNGDDHRAREVLSGHYVPVTPTPLKNPQYVAHSHQLFADLGLSDELAGDSAFQDLFAGNLAQAPAPMRQFGWATGYALSIYGTEYVRQCPFGTGNGYGDGRAISVVEGLFRGKRWEMQLKGGGPTPYCRGGDGRAVLRSSVREFLAQELMHALGIPTSRSLMLMVGQEEEVYRPWYSEQSQSLDPDIMTSNRAAISTRVAPSFLRVGQLELFARRVRSQAHPHAPAELRMITAHLIAREYPELLQQGGLAFQDQVVALMAAFRDRLTSLVTHWLRVGYCQGNFNSDNCAAGGFTLDYGPFGFCERFDPMFQPWTGGGEHFSFFNQPMAAEANAHMLWQSLRLLLSEHPEQLEQIDALREGFSTEINAKIEAMWSQKLGLAQPDPLLVKRLFELMQASAADFTILFRELSALPTSVTSLERSFGLAPDAAQQHHWSQWLKDWHQRLSQAGTPAGISAQMRRVNPKYTWREWLVAPAYQAAEQGDYTLVKELQTILNHPYDEQSEAIAHRFDQPRPAALTFAGGISHYSCSS